jgi:hypothetical protein
MWAVDRFHAERLRDQQGLLRLLLEKIKPEVTRRHGQAIGVEIGLDRLQLAFVHARIEAAITFDFRITGLNREG